METIAAREETNGVGVRTAERRGRGLRVALSAGQEDCPVQPEEDRQEEDYLELEQQRDKAV